LPKHQPAIIEASGRGDQKERMVAILETVIIFKRIPRSLLRGAPPQFD
jgi:hypothetical protein